MTHTPGPWHITRVFPGYDGIRISGGKDHDIATLLINDKNLVHGEANAALIAAAPELLAALQLAVAHIGYENKAVHDQLAGAITKATGDRYYYYEHTPDEGGFDVIRYDPVDAVSPAHQSVIGHVKTRWSADKIAHALHLKDRAKQIWSKVRAAITKAERKIE